MIKLFVSSSVPHCPACKAARKYFNMVSLEYEEIDIATNRPEANLMYKKSSSLMIPQITIGEEVVIGFSARQVGSAINKIIRNASVK